MVKAQSLISWKKICRLKCIAVWLLEKTPEINIALLANWELILIIYIGRVVSAKNLTKEYLLETNFNNMERHSGSQVLNKKRYIRNFGNDE